MLFIAVLSSSKKKMLDPFRAQEIISKYFCVSLGSKAVVMMLSNEVRAGVKMLFHFKLTLISSNTSNYSKGLGNQMTFLYQECAVF